VVKLADTSSYLGDGEERNKGTSAELADRSESPNRTMNGSTPSSTAINKTL